MIKLISISLSLICTIVVFAQEDLDPNGYNKLYYPNGSIQSEGMLKNGKPEGYWINYYPTGVKKSEGKRTNYQLDSIWVFYNIVGDTTSKIHYLNGKKNGYYIKYYEKPEIYKGNIKSKELYLNDKIESTANYYFEDGKLKERANYSDNKREGYSYEYAEDGRLITIYNYRKGTIKERTRINRYNSERLKVGLWQEFYDGYRLKEESHYKNGLLDGYYKEYDVNGKLSLTLLYRDGVLVETVDEEDIESQEQIEYFSDGTVKKTGYFIENKPVGVHKEYSKEGEVTVTSIYTDNSILSEKGIIDNESKRTGDWEVYYKTGEVKARGNYKNNLKEGTWTYYFKNGNVEQSGTYSNGRYSGVWKWYYSSGELWKEEEYYNGREEGIYYEYDVFGNIIVEGEFFDGEKEGKWLTVINSFKAEGAYVTGLMDGKWKHYYDNGQVAYEGHYIQGNAEGKHRFFYADGTLKEEQYYNNGLREKHWKKFNKLGELIITVSYKNDVEYRINGIKVEFPENSTTIIN